MSQLIQMRNRIKAIETIEKITHAMQLISMSTHARLRERKTHIEEYQNTIATLFKKVASQVPDWHNPVLMPSSSRDELPLIILIGSQKGLCGTFNLNLFSRFERDLRAADFPMQCLLLLVKKQQIIFIVSSHHFQFQ